MGKNILKQSRPALVSIILILLLIGFSYGYLFLSFVDGQFTTEIAPNEELLERIMDMRIAKAGPIILVGLSIGISTTAFQTVTHNRLLTPNIMGLDALFVFIQTMLVFYLGSENVIAIDKPIMYAIEAISLLAVSIAAFYFIFVKSKKNIITLALVGIVIGTFLKSLTSFYQRLINPQEYLIVQDRSYARFDGVDYGLFIVTTVISLLAFVVLWTLRHKLDVLTLGRIQSVGLGLSYSSVVVTTLICCVLLVSVSTALVGPLTFLGLLVSNLAAEATKTYKHFWLLPVSGLFGATVLMGSQFILERILGMGTVVAVIIELVGGTLFLIMVLRGLRR